MATTGVDPITLPSRILALIVWVAGYEAACFSSGLRNLRVTSTGPLA